MKSFNKKINGGYSFIEIIFYIALFAVSALVIIDSLVTMTRAFREVVVATDLVQNSSIMERMSREIRQAVSVNSITGTSLTLNSEDESGNSKTVRFSLSGTDIELFENDVLVGDMNTPNVEITSLSFTQITTSLGTAVKVNFSGRSVRDKQNRVEDFFNTIVLRGGY